MRKDLLGSRRTTTELLRHKKKPWSSSTYGLRSAYVQAGDAFIDGNSIAASNVAHSVSRLMHLPMEFVSFSGIVGLNPFGILQYIPS